MDLSIIIVNWNSVHFLDKCLKSISPSLGDAECEIIVVDNASYDGSEDLIKINHPDVIFIQSKDNLGFAYANNLGYQHSKGRCLLFLNPDTEVIGQAVETMLSNLERTADAGAIGCKLLNSDLSVQTSCIQSFPTILNQVLDIESLKLKTPQLKLWGIGPLFLESDRPQEVEVISGACIMVKRAVFEEIGMFSSDYFMYSEDLDLCRKVKQKGYKAYFIGTAEVVHHGGGSSKKQGVSLFGVVQMRESIFKLLKKTRGKSYAYLYRAAMFLVSMCRIIFIALLSPLAVLIKGKNGFYQPMRKWTSILRWSLGLEVWVR